MFSSKFLNVLKPTSNVAERCSYYLPQLWYQKKIKSKKVSRFDGKQSLFYGNKSEIPTALFQRSSCRQYCSGLGLGAEEGFVEGTVEELNWRDVLIEAERLVGYPSSFLQLRWLFNDEVASTAILLRKVVGNNHRVLKSAKNLLAGPKSNLQSAGLIILLVSKAAGYKGLNCNDTFFNNGVLNAQRALAEIVEMKRTGHMLRKAIQQIPEKERNEKKYKDLPNCDKIAEWTGEHLLSTCLQHQGGLRNHELTELITSGLRDLEDGEAFGPRDDSNNPVPSKPKGDDQPACYDWENENNLNKLGSEDYLGNGIAEWILRTMLCSASIIGKGCQGAMKLAHRGPNIEKDAYKLGCHMALLGQLYIDVRDFFTHTYSYSIVGAPTIIAMWEYPQIYGHVLESKIEKKPIEINRLYYSVRSTRAMDYLTKFLDDELDAVMKYSDKLPEDDARLVLQKLALTLHRETHQYIEK